ncbi:protein-S-isoprenylcysteine O-methyltransferase Ste14 [Sphingobium fontiphilum]|uniref:Protein-S-isoprenylcysteine O-methyltransferase Ste14 n=1 Tax=Sphingobium fontiphilum TaxID=944425 RepID=A0A7W6GPH9_9SPHN|nr:isoprenylcysteine carboxylmethyltransferase family protein [Sphingobium fontiphilum]MBB3982865.1 protein-S-isoprenylcysteine O-methyltransferase Ste14 [Sphingobium fontiphilum]
MEPSSDPCPKSAVSHGVGLAGLVGLGLWTLVARHYGMNGPNAGFAAVAACALPMVLWSLLVDRVHRNASTGIDWDMAPRPWRSAFDTALVKIAGLWATWLAIAIFYCLARWYWQGNYHFAMDLFAWSAPGLVLLSIPYVTWLDRRLREPRDATYAFGQWVIGGAAGAPDMAQVAHHARAWAVKGFFLAFMVSIVPGNFADVVGWSIGRAISNPVDLALFLIAVMFMIDVVMATVGYVLTMKPLDAHIRTANPYLAGWLAALICYPPFVLMGGGGPLDYHAGGAEWFVWTQGNTPLQWLLGGWLVVLTGLYAWATVAFGLRFSNLTHRGILTHGPYRWTRHPAYLSKNLFWWFSSMPFLAVSGSIADIARNCAMLAATNAVYFWRAKTEEKHLSADPDYRAYSEWMERNGPAPRFFAWVTGKRSGARAGLHPAE